MCVYVEYKEEEERDHFEVMACAPCECEKAMKKKIGWPAACLLTFGAKRELLRDRGVLLLVRADGACRQREQRNDYVDQASHRSQLSTRSRTESSLSSRGSTGGHVRLQLAAGAGATAHIQRAVPAAAATLDARRYKWCFEPATIAVRDGSISLFCHRGCIGKMRRLSHSRHVNE